MAKATKKRISDAPESNAGDDFHILWAVRKCLNLLNLRDNRTKAIYIEGAESIESTEMDEAGDKLLGIDLSEYIDAEKFEEASSIVFTQLKYSTRNPNQNWTVSRLCRGKKHKHSGSIVQRLASIYRTYSEKYGHEVTTRKVTLKLVSNQKADPGTIEFLNRLKDASINTSSINPLKAEDEYKLFKAASSLNDNDLLRFATALDLNDCGTLNRHDQKNLVYIEIAKVTAADSEKQYNRLHQMVWNKMMPENRGRNKLTIEDVLHCFECNTIEDLFPALPSFENNPNIIEREQTQDFIELITNGSNYLCLHAGAGMGKSTLARSLPSYLPEGSIAVVFDCYGGGSYTYPSDKRHKHEWAFMEIINELAIECGTPLLLQRREAAEVYLREFKKRLKQCAEIIYSQNRQAIVLIIIDAADNSISAAEGDSTQSFVSDLVREKLPDRCALIVTSRTHRVGKMKLPSHWLLKEINAFTLSETTLSLAKQGLAVSSEKIAEFHDLTRGIPRVQSYALSDFSLGIDAVMETLKPNGKELDDLMAQQIELALSKVGDIEKMNLILSLLITLPRPIPLSYISGITNSDRAIIEDISTDLWKGIVYENGHFSFRDEDYETFLRSKYAASQSLLESIASYFQANAQSEDYASVNLAQVLIFAGKFSILSDIVLNKKFTAVPLDPIRNKEVFIERTMLAMKYSRKVSDDHLTFQKLQVIAGEAAKTDKTLKNILIENADLTASYGDLRTVQKIYFQSEESTWYGPVHLKSAAIYSRESNTHSLANKHLRSAESWIDWRSRLPDEELREYPLTAYDLSYGAESYLRIHGLKQTAGWIRRWNNRELMIGAVVPLIRRILISMPTSEIVNLFNSSFIRTDIKIIAFNLSIEFGIFSLFNEDELLRDAVRTLKKKKTILPDFLHHCVGLLDFCRSRSVHYQNLSELLRPFTPGLLSRVPEFHSGSFYNQDRLKMDLIFKLKCHASIEEEKELKLDDFYPDSLKKVLNEKDPNNNERHQRDKQDFDRIYKHLLAVYSARKDFLMNRCSEDDLKQRVIEISDELSKNTDLNYYERHSAPQVYNFIAVRLVDILPLLTKKEAFLLLIKERFLEEKRNGISLRIALSNSILSLTECRKVAIKLLSEVDKKLISSTMSGPSKIEYYAQVTAIANKIDLKLGKFYFDKLIDTASDIDGSAFDQIRCISKIAQNGVFIFDAKLAFEYSNFVEYCYERLKEYEDFPWEEAVRGITRIDNSSGFAIVSRWDHKGYFKFEKYVAAITATSLENAAISEIDALSFLAVYPFYDEHHFYIFSLILRRLERNGKVELRNRFLRLIVKDITINCPQTRIFNLCRELLAEIKDLKGLDSEVLDVLNRYIKFQADLHTEEESNFEGPLNIKEDNPKESSLTDDFSKIDATDILMVERALAKTRDDPGFSNRKRVDRLLDCVKDDSEPTSYISQLNVLISLSKDYVSFYSFKAALESRLKEWDFYHTVQEWKRDSFEKVLKLWIHNFVWQEDFLDVSGLTEFAALFGINERGLCEILEQIIPDLIDQLSGSIIYQFLQLTTKINSSEKNSALLTWLISRWNENTDHDLNDGSWRTEVAPPAKSAEVFSLTFRSLLGNPNKKLRWRAIKGLRWLAEFGNFSSIKYLIENQERRDCGSFSYGKYPYYWLSAKLYLWIAVDKLLRDSFKKMADVIPAIIKLPEQDEIDHALVNYFRKRAYQTIIQYQPDSVSDLTLQYVKDMVTSKLAPVKEKTNLYNGPRSQKEKRKLKFDFDHIDVVSYWYEPLGTLFGLSGYEIALKADSVIADQFGYHGEVHKDNHVVRDDGHYRSKDHGDIPIVEDLQSYYEYHSMFVVAADLIKNKPLVKQRNWRREWKDWIAGHGLAWNNHWIVDLRDPIPLDKRFWISEMTHESWHDTLNIGEFEKHLRLESVANNAMIPVKATYSLYNHKDHETICISSALVSTKTSFSLLRALQTAKNSHDFAIPVESDSDRMEINRPPFIFKGWLREISYENRGLDSHDPAAKDWSKYVIEFGENFKKWANLERSIDFRYYKATGMSDGIVGKYESWSNVTDRGNYGDFQNEGRRLLIDKNLLLKFLKHTRASLLVECSISKWRDSREGMGRHHEFNKLFLIDHNGKIRSFDGDHQLG